MIATKAKLGSIAPCFIVKDLSRAISFYKESLGFELAFAGPEDDPYIAIVRRDDIQIFIKQVAPEIEPIPNKPRHEYSPWDAYIYVPEPDLLAEELRSRGLDVTATDNSDNLRGFEVQDADGYTLYMGRPN